jgi:hypothetical protein
MGIEQFVLARDQDYDAVRALAEQVGTLTE